MKLENQVCSLELAKKLKELGVRQESEFYWSPYTKKISQSRGNQSTSAFTVAELGELGIADSNVEWKLFKSKNGWMIYPAGTPGFTAGTPGFTADIPTFVADTEADARAKMLIYLIQHGLVDDTKAI